MAKARVSFVTGFPGFIGRRLIKRLAEQDPKRSYVLLVQPQLRELADKQVAELSEAVPGIAERIELVEGDITATDLGLGEAGYKAVAKRITDVWHLAAIYNLAVKKSVAYRINVIGTSNVLDLCEAADVERHHYISTCYVAGDRHGHVSEEDLDCDQDFKNHYESTKFWAELEVRRRMGRIPTTIYRPAIVVGDSTTGATDKYDGPYYLVRACLDAPAKLPVPVIGTDETRFNIVPVDFVVESMVIISAREDSLGKTYALADPNPLSSRELVETILRALGKPVSKFALPPAIAMKLAETTGILKFLKLPPQAAAYLDHPVDFDTRNTQQALADSGLKCASPRDYMPTLIEYMKTHPDKSFLDGRAF